mgnify:CR=1 FL=1
MSTFLALVQAAANELGIPEPSQVIGAADDTSKQLLALSNREGKEFFQMANKNGGWQKLHKEYTFTTTGYSTTGTVTNASAVITAIPSTSGYSVGMLVTGTGIGINAAILTVDSGTQVTLDTAATATGTAVSLTFGVDNYALPSDLEYFAAKTFFDKTYRWMLLGPLEAEEKQILKYGIVAVGPRRQFWIRNDRMYIRPVPSNLTDVLAYDYMSNAWCASAGGTAQKVWTADTDTYYLDEDCFILGLKWRFLRAKGLDYSQEFDTYMKAANRVMGRDGGARDLKLNAQAVAIGLISSNNIPETGFGQ